MQFVERFREFVGWCPNAPVLRTATVVLAVPSAAAHSAQPGGREASGRGRIRHGIGIAAGSIRALIGDRHLFWFSLMAGLVILLLIAVEAWFLAHTGSILPLLLDIQAGDTFFLLDTRLFLLQAVCFSAFTLVMAALFLYRSRNGAATTLTIRDAFALVSPHTITLAGLSLLMALTGTFLEAIVTQTWFFGKIVSGITMTVFWLPYAYYFPNVFSSAVFFSAIIIAVDAILFLLALYVIPLIVLENRKLLPAFAGSAALVKKTWQEVLGCILVLGAIILGNAAIALVIGQSPLLLGHDYDFFLSSTRGLFLMTGVCYGFILASGILAAIGSTVTGIAIADLYACGSTGRLPENGMPAEGGPAR
jgi:hypothetical protein